MQTVTSKDGTKIAYDKTGTGPIIILVAGAMGTRTFGFPELAKLLAPHFTVYNYDRRGRGDSTDAQPFAVEREIEDIEALVDAAGGWAYLYGISSGACLAMAAAIQLGDKIKKLAMYEAPYDSNPEAKAPWHEYTTKLKELLAEDRRGDMVALFMKQVGVPEEHIAGMRQSPMWAGLEAVAPTLIYDAAEMGEDRAVPPAEYLAKARAKTLVLDSGESLKTMPFMHASAEALAKGIPHAKQQTIAGQRHDVSSEALAPVLIHFFEEG